MADVKKQRKRAKTTKSGRVTESPSSRYTPPSPKVHRSSPKWVPVSMFAFFGIGVAVIILDYLPGAPLLPGDTSNNWYLLAGLGFILLGFISASRFH